MPSPMKTTTLLTDTPAEGQLLANHLTTDLLASLSVTQPDTMPEHLRTAASAPPDAALVSAIYFHAISQANQGWRG